MTDTESLRVRLGKSTGWTWVGGWTGMGEHPNQDYWSKEDRQYVRLPPLSALVRESEQGLTMEQQKAYAKALRRAGWLRMGDDEAGRHYLHRADDLLSLHHRIRRSQGRSTAGGDLILTFISPPCLYAGNHEHARLRPRGHG